MDEPLHGYRVETPEGEVTFVGLIDEAIAHFINAKQGDRLVTPAGRVLGVVTDRPKSVQTTGKVWA